MNARQLIDDAIIHEDNGLLPHSIHYSQTDPSRYPVTAKALRDAGYHKFRYYWLHIPSGCGGVSTVWVPVERWAAVLVEFWNRVGGTVWKYSL